MADILIRNLPDAVVADIDAAASKLGISRVEYVRRQLIQEARRMSQSVSADDLRASDDRLSALLDDELMGRAWR